MPTNYTGDPANFYDTVPLPSDSDLRNSNSMGVAFQPIVDSLAYLKRCQLDVINGGTYAGAGFATLTGSGCGLTVTIGAKLGIWDEGIMESVSTGHWTGTFNFETGILTFDTASELKFGPSTRLTGGVGGGNSIFDGTWLWTSGVVVSSLAAWTIQATGSLVFAANSSLNVQAGANVTLAGAFTGSSSGSWTGTFKYDASAVVEFKGTLDVSGIGSRLSCGANTTFELKDNCQGFIRTGTGLAVDAGASIYNSGTIDNGTAGHSKPFCGKLVDPAATVTPYATAVATPELVSITMASASSAITIVPGTIRQKIKVTVAQSSSTWTATLNFQKVGGGLSCAFDMRNTSGAIVAAELWNDGTDWLIVSQTKG